MKNIANFFTLYWIIYFPTCIAYNDIGPLKYVDELMTGVLILFTFMRMRSRYIVKEPKREISQYIKILSFFVMYGLLFGANVSSAVWRDLIQWIRPFSVIYCTWMLNPQFTRMQKKWMLYAMLATMGSWIVYHPEVTKIGANAEFAVLGQLAMCSGMVWYLFNKESKRNRNIAMLLVLAGLLAPKFKYLGEVVCVVYMLFFLKKRLNFKSVKTIVPMTLIVSVILLLTWFKFDAYYVSGFSATGYDRLARPESYKTALLILKDYFPFGSGMGTFGVAAAADYYSPLYYKYNLNTIWGLDPKNPMFLADAFYPTLAQFGVVGLCFFYVFWKRRLKAFNVIQDMRCYRVAWISFFCLAIEQTADTSFLSGKGMGYCMLIALCLNANRNMGLRDDGTPYEQLNVEEELEEVREKNWRNIRRDVHGHIIENTNEA